MQTNIGCLRANGTSDSSWCRDHLFYMYICFCVVLVWCAHFKRHFYLTGRTNLHGIYMYLYFNSIFVFVCLCHVDEFSINSLCNVK